MPRRISVQDPTFYTFVSDYGPYDLAGKEVAARIDANWSTKVLRRQSSALPVHLASTTVPFDTVANGRYVAEVARGATSPGVLLHNVAPRNANRELPRVRNEGEELFAARTDAGVLLVGFNSGLSWAYTAALGVDIYRVPFRTSSQFRGRDVIPEQAAKLWDTDLRHLEKVTGSDLQTLLDLAGNPGIEPLGSVNEYSGASPVKDKSAAGNAGSIRAFVIGPHVRDKHRFRARCEELFGAGTALAGSAVHSAPAAINSAGRTGSPDLVSAGFIAGQLGLNAQTPTIIVIDSVGAASSGRLATAYNRSSRTLFIGPAHEDPWRQISEAGLTVSALPPSVTDPAEVTAKLWQSAAAGVPYSGEPLPVPKRSGTSVAYCDFYGNIKLHGRPNVPNGSLVEVSINGTTHRAVAGEGVFEVPTGVLTLANGSSKANGVVHKELFWRGKSAAHEFGLERGDHGWSAGTDVTVEVLRPLGPSDFADLRVEAITPSYAGVVGLGTIGL